MNDIEETGVAEFVKIGDDGSMHPTHAMGKAKFQYNRNDPAAVTVELTQGDGNSSTGNKSTWTFARDLLNRGRFEPTGHGDVRIFRHGSHIYLHLIGVDPTATNQQARDTEAVYRVPLRVVVTFLRQTVDLVPYGTETYDIDALIHQFEERSNG